jgi:hypothetical protein
MCGGIHEKRIREEKVVGEIAVIKEILANGELLPRNLFRYHV